MLWTLHLLRFFAAVCFVFSMEGWASLVRCIRRMWQRSSGGSCCRILLLCRKDAGQREHELRDVFDAVRYAAIFNRITNTAVIAPISSGAAFARRSGMPCP